MKKALVVLTLFVLSAVGFACPEQEGGRSCPTTITSCGCTITQPGSYYVGAWLTYDQGLTPDNACVSIYAPNVKLYTQGYGILGPGYVPGASVGPKGMTGIYVDEDAFNTFLEAQSAPNSPPSSVLLGWQYGLHSRANNLTADGFGYDVNVTGAFLEGVQQNKITLSEALENDQYGIEISGGFNNSVSSLTLGGNAKAGLYITGHSSQNTVTTVSNDQAASPDYPQSYGIEIANGSTRNTVSNTSMFGDGTYDMFDGNSTAVNTWEENQFATANKSYIH